MNYNDYEECLAFMNEAFATVSKSESGNTLSELADSYVWKRPLENMLNAFHYEHLKLERKRGLLFSGKPGNGRHTCADAFIQSVCKNEMCFDEAGTITFRADDFSRDQFSTNDEIRNYISAVFEVAEMSGSYFFIIFDEMEKYYRLSAISNCIADAFSAVGEKVYLICITQDASRLTPDLRRKLLNCRFAAPDKDEREDYLHENLSFVVSDWLVGENNLKTVQIILSDMSTDEAAEKTEGFSYRDLEELVFALKMEIASAQIPEESHSIVSVSRKKVERFIASIGPARRTSPAPIQVVTAAAAPAAVQTQNNDKARLQELTKEGKVRTIEEELELIELVPALNEN